MTGGPEEGDGGSLPSGPGLRAGLLTVARRLEETSLRLLTDVAECRETQRLAQAEAEGLEGEGGAAARARLRDVLDEAPEPLRGRLRDAYMEASRLTYGAAAARERGRLMRVRQDAEGVFLDELRQASIELGALLRRVDGGGPASAGGGAPPLDVELERCILMAQEDEKKRVAIVVHDGPAQILANLIMRVDFCARLLGRSPADATVELTSLRREMQELLDGVRRLIFELRPMTLDDLGLVPTVQRFVENARCLLPFELQLIVRGSVEPLEKLTEVVLYRVLQEAVGNVERHAEAARATVRLEGAPGWVTLEVEDDGRGLDPGRLDEMVAMGRLGLHTARKRVELVGGRFDVGVVSPRGTVVRARVPRSRGR